MSERRKSKKEKGPDIHLLIGQPVINADYVSLVVTNRTASLRLDPDPFAELQVAEDIQKFNVVTSNKESWPPGTSVIKVRVLGNTEEDDVCTAPRHYELQGVSYSLPATLLRGGEGFMKVINTGTNDIEWEAGQVLARAGSCDQSAIQPSQDPELQMRMKFRAKCRFRAIGRMVQANTYWMIEAADTYEGLEDVKRRVAQAVRAKTKKKQLLNFNDKALLNKPAEDRTEAEKKYLYRIIGGLKCFKRYPNHVKKKLAAVAYFKYYGPGRVIVRQHHEALALYFILTGDIVVSQMVYDELLQKYVSVDIGVLHAGNMFGEVSLLHNIPRTATCTTTGHCELLQLMKEDFKNILQASVQQQWDEVRQAMSAFSYFDALDEVARREGCIVAKMKSYEINEIILGDGVGVANFVYFVLSGQCQMIESMNVVVTKHLSKTFYSLYDPYVPKEESEQDMDTKYFAAYTLPAVTPETSSVSATKSKEKRPSAPTTIFAKDDRVSVSVQTPKPLVSILKIKEGSTDSNVVTDIPVKSSTLVQDVSTQDDVKSKSQESGVPVVEGSTVILSSRRESVRFSIDSSKQPPPNLRTYFMQVCRFNPGSTFGFGENMRDRRIVALTHVDCMLLPKIWLLQRNTANIWTRIEHYLEKKIPTKKQLFKVFLSERHWYDYRDLLVKDVVARSNTVNWTSMHDVPYSIRLEEIVDI